MREPVASQVVSGQLLANDAAQAVTALAFLVGVKARLDSSARVWFIGSEPERELRSFPSYGLTAKELGGLFREGVNLVGDRAIVDADPLRGVQIGEVLAAFSNRLSLTLELVAIDVASNSVDRVNAWLDQVSIGAGVVARSAAVVVDPSQVVLQQPRNAFNWDVQLQALFAMLDVSGGARLELRQQIQVMSGTTTHFESGEIVETPLIVREPLTGKDLITQIDRRTVGLQLDLTATAVAGRWLINVEFQDSSVVAGREVTTAMRTARMVTLSQRPVLLASFTRTTGTDSVKAVPVLGSIPKLGKALFRKTVTTKAARSLMILCRPVFESAP